MDVSIVIPSLNAAGLPDTVASLRRQTRAADISEVIVVGLDEAGVLKEELGVRFVSTGRPVGPAAARNIGVERARHSTVCFIDADCLAHERWLESLMARQAAGEPIVGGSVEIESSNYWTLADNLSMFHEYMSHWPPGPRRYLPTLNLLVEKPVFERVGLLDDSLMRGEDVDWTIRARRAGYRIFFEPAARVRHVPARAGLSSVLRHWWQSGYYMRQVRWRYRDEYRTPRLAHSRLALIALSPAVSAWSTLRLFLEHRGRWRYLHTAPVVWLTKMAWCFGAARRGGAPVTEEAGGSAL